jgi:serine protease inhibitor
VDIKDLRQQGRFTVKKRGILSKAVVLCLLPASLALGQPKAGLSDIVAGNNAFAFDLYAQLKSAEGNIFFSPYSISTALAMTYAGARGNTGKQMMRVLHFGKNETAFHEGFGKLQAGINEARRQGDVKLSVANGLWMQKDYKFLAEFLEMTGKNYGAELNYADYKNETEKARVEINTWVEGRTNDKIKELIRPGVLDASTRMVLANAIYFKGAWATKFDTAKTEEMPFRVSARDSVKMKMMNTGEKEFGYGENKSVQILDMPYAGRELSMIVILPRTKTGLGDFEKEIRAELFDSLCAGMRQEKVVVYLPKFTTTRECVLKKVLQKMGITDAFSEESADFSGMSSNKDLKISEVIHKAFVDVNEEGTEAAAATAVVVGLRCAPVYHKPHIFRADHPFLFVIRDNTTGSILFMGRMVNPAR